MDLPSTPLILLGILVFWHFVFDLPLQGPFISAAKNPKNPTPGVPWWYIMFAHSFLHAGSVAFITGSVWLGIYELICHFITDYFKCRNRLTFLQDQMIHLGAKILYVLAITQGWNYDLS